jgi:hypothetical protein
MTSAAHEFIIDLEPAISTPERQRYHASVVARAASDGHWNAWLEFVADGTENVLRTDIETHQATDAHLHRWAATLTDVYLQGALGRAQLSPSDTLAHRWALATAAVPGQSGVATAFDPFELFALGEHVLRRELQLFHRATLLALIINYDLNPRALNVSTFTKSQLIAFIVTAVEVRESRRATPGQRSQQRMAHAC